VKYYVEKTKKDPEQRDCFMSLASLEHELEGLAMETGREIDREIVEGPYHAGLCAVVQVAARRP
jgi:hypothetical protein